MPTIDALGLGLVCSSVFGQLYQLRHKRRKAFYCLELTRIVEFHHAIHFIVQGVEKQALLLVKVTRYRCVQPRIHNLAIRSHGLRQ